MSEVPTSSSKNSGPAPVRSESEAPTPEETKVEGTEPEAIATEPRAEPEPTPSVGGEGQTPEGNEDAPKAAEQSGDAPSEAEATPPAPPVAPPAEETTPEPEAAPDATDLPGRAMFSLPIRKIAEFCKVHSAQVRRIFYPGEVEDALAKKGLTVDDAAGDPKDVEHWKALSLYSGEGPACFHSIDGWWKASVNPDGSFEVTKLANTSLASRVGSQADSADQTFKGHSLETFIAMMEELLATSDEIIEDSLAQVEDARQKAEADMAERERLAARRPEEIPTDPDDEALSKAAVEFGVQNLEGEARILKLAHCLGVPVLEDPADVEVEDPETGEKKIVKETQNAHDHNGGVMMDPTAPSKPLMVPKWGPPRAIEDVKADVLEKIKEQAKAA